MTANGSRRWFQYTSDTALTFAVELDESIYETAALGFAPIDTGASGPTAQGRVLSVSSTRPLTMRSISLSRSDANGDVFRRRVFVGNASEDVFTGATAAVTIDGEVWSILGARGEQRKLVPASDTGITDGDVDSNITV